MHLLAQETLEHQERRQDLGIKRPSLNHKLELPIKSFNLESESIIERPRPEGGDLVVLDGGAPTPNSVLNPMSATSKTLRIPQAWILILRAMQTSLSDFDSPRLSWMRIGSVGSIPRSFKVLCPYS
jgi:hypothetical protein